MTASRKQRWCHEKDLVTVTAGSETKAGPQAKECEKVLAAGKEQAKESPLEPQVEGMQSC